MANENAVFVLNEGTTFPTDFTVAPAVGTYNLKVPVNPRIVTQGASNSTVLGIHCYEILTEDSQTLTATCTYNAGTTIDMLGTAPSITVGASVSGTGIPSGAYVESITNSNTFELSVATTGDGGSIQTLTFTNVNACGNQDSNVLNRSFPAGTDVYDSTAINTYASNQSETAGNLVVLDMLITTSSNTVSSAGTSTTRDEFIIIYADDPRKHQIAKITNRELHEGTLYNFTFTPTLKENIPANTKIAIYQGPLKSSSNVVAVAYGLHNDVNTSEERHDKYVELSRPTFYFYEGSSLDPSRKYTVLKTSKSEGVVALKTAKSVFVTAPVTSGFIVDKGFFTHNGEVIDNNQLNDTLHFTTGSANGVSPRGINTATAQGATYTFDYTSWTGSSRNYDDTDGSLSSYIKFVDSPSRSQIISVPFRVETSKTVTNKGNMFKASYYDNERMLEHKINDNEGVKIKEMIHQTLISDKPSSSLPGLFSKESATTISVSGLINQDLRNLLYDGSSSYEPILVGDYYYTISGITAPVDGVQEITVTFRRHYTDAAYENISVNGVHNHTNVRALRHIWSAVVENMIVGHDIDTNIDTNIYRNNVQLDEIEADIYNLEYRIDGDYAGFDLKVKRGDKNDGYTELISNPPSSYYSTGNIMSSLKGNLITNKVVFEGNIESVETDIEQGAFKLTISGRDDISKLLSTPLNKNYIYSEEYVYSTITPFTDTFTSTGLTATSATSLRGNLVTTTGTSLVALTYGDVLYIKYGYDSNTNYVPLGVVGADKAKGVSGSITLLTDSLLDLDGLYDGNGSMIEPIYVGNKKLLAGKSLTTHTRDSSVTTLYGSADKAYVMKGTGKTFNLITESTSFPNYNTKNSPTILTGNNVDNIIATQGTSAQPTDTPLGFDIDVDMMGSLCNLDVIEKNSNDGITDIEVGYISPIVLGRLDENTLDTYYNNLSDLGLINTQGLDGGGFLHLLDNRNSSSGSVYGYAPTTFRRIISDDRSFSSSDIYNNYSFRFGTPIFRYNNLSKGTLKYYRNKIHMISKALKPDINTYYINNDISIKGSASAFRIMANKVIERNLNTDFTTTASENKKEMPISSRGYLPAVGSTTQDITNYPDVFETSIYNLSKTSVQSSTWLHNTSLAGFTRPKLEYEMDDPSIFNAFLMAPGDMLVESQKRYDNFFNTNLNRNMSDYYLMVKYKNPKSNTTISHSNYIGKSKIEKVSDDSFEYYPIENNLTFTPKRFSVLKLRHMTVDAYMNEVNFETYKLRSAESNLPSSTGGGGLLTDMSYYPKSLPEVGYTVYKCNTYSPTTGSSTIFVDNIAGLDLTVDLSTYGASASSNVNIALFTNPSQDSTGLSRFLGTVSSTSTGSLGSASPFITLTANCEVVGYSGEIFTADGIWGINGNASTVLKNGNSIKWDDQVNPVGHNHNVLLLNEHNSTTMLNLQSLKRMATNNTVQCPMIYKGTVTFSNRTDAGGGDNNIRINFPTQSNDSNTVLTNHFIVGNDIVLSGHTTASLNGTYTIDAVSSTYIDVHISGTVANNSSAVEVTIVTPKRKEANIAHPYRMLNDSAFLNHYAPTTVDSTVNRSDISTYNDMGLVVVGFSQDSHFGSQAGNQYNLERDLYLRDACNIGTTIDSAWIKDLGGYDFLGFEIPYLLDNFRATSDIGTNEYVPNDSNVRDLTMHKAVAEVLYIPKIDMAANGVTNIEGATTGIDYDDEGYIAIQVQYDIETTNHDTIESFSYWVHYVGDLTGKFLYNENDKTLHKILNHSISKLDTTEAFIHYLHIDNYTHGSVGASDIFSVLTIANDTFGPDKKDYVLNRMSGTNVINPHTGKFFTSEKTKTDFTVTDCTKEGYTWTKGDHAVQAMYVVAELDGHGSEYLIHRQDSPIFHADTGNKFYPESSYSMYITDGNKSLDTNMLVKYDTYSHTTKEYSLHFDKMESMRGCVSLGETFTISVLGDVKDNIESVKIVSAFSILPEIDDIVKDIMDEADAEYTEGTETAQYYLGLNYTGENAFAAINNALSFKNQKLKINGGEIKIVSNQDAKDYRSIEFNEDENTYKIVKIKKDKSLYDKFNSVVVYGDNVKGVAKNRRDIKKNKERVKEIYDFSLISQQQVDEKSKNLLKVYSSLNKAIMIEVGDKIPYLEPGQIISVYYPSENIYRSEYMVVEIKKETGTPTTILLGEYNRDLADTFAMLLSETRNLQGRSQQKVYKSVTSPNIDIQAVRVKFVKATINSSDSVLTSTLGFTNTIGFGAVTGL